MSVNTGNLEHAHADNRRVIFECNLPTSSVQKFFINAKEPLGNHYHKERHETFVIISGQGKCACLPLNKDGELQGELVVFPIKQGSVIQVTPFTAHAFRLEPESTMICFSSIPFDPENPDMFVYQLEV
jgi:quercetin dioxygenase-like cupin family protein